MRSSRFERGHPGGRHRRSAAGGRHQERRHRSGSQQQIDDLPINGRRVDTFVLLTPAVTNDGEFGLVSFRGIAAATPSSPTATTPPTASTTRTPAAPASAARSRRTPCRSSRCSPTASRPSSAAPWAASSTPSPAAEPTSIHGTGYWFFRNRTLEAARPLRQWPQPPGMAPHGGRQLSAAPIKKDKLFYLRQFRLHQPQFPGPEPHRQHSRLTDPTGNFIPPPTAPRPAPRRRSAPPPSASSRSR